MQEMKMPNERLMDKARRELLAKAYTLILADDWLEEREETVVAADKLQKTESQEVQNDGRVDN